MMKKIGYIICTFLILLLVSCNKNNYTILESGEVNYYDSNNEMIQDYYRIIEEHESELVIIESYDEYQEYRWLSEKLIDEEHFKENYLLLNVIKASMFEIKDGVFLEEIENSNGNLIITYSVDEQYYYYDGLQYYHRYMYFFISVPKDTSLPIDKPTYGLKFFDRYYNEEGSRYYTSGIEYFPIYK